jgi:hypothetical protein
MNRHRKNAIPAALMAAAYAILILSLPVVSGSAKGEVNYVLMLQQTPADGGSVSPETGVHSVAANGAVTVVARPKPGYQFAHWLGDVADSTSNSTTVSVNAPKVVVAVFQRSEYDLPFAEPSPPDSIGGGGSLVPNRQYIGGGGGVSPAGPGNPSYSSSYSYIGPTNIVNPPADNTDNSRNDPPPVPEVPEPATVLLLGLGSLLALNRRK